MVTTSRYQSSGCVLWFTGLSGAGKSTIARLVAEECQRRGQRVEYLDGDAIRDVFPATGYTREERDAHVKRVGFLAGRLAHHGVTVVCALISPYRAAREEARRRCPRFIEVHVATPLATCEQRDPKGLYARARRGEILHFTGIDDPYEEPLAPELRIDASSVSISEAVQRVLSTLDRTDALSGRNDHVG